MSLFMYIEFSFSKFTMECYYQQNSISMFGSVNSDFFHAGVPDKHKLYMNFATNSFQQPDEIQLKN